MTTTTTTYKTTRAVVIREQPSAFARELGRLRSGRIVSGQSARDTAWVMRDIGGYVERARLHAIDPRATPKRPDCTRRGCKNTPRIGCVRCDACQAKTRAWSTKFRKRRRAHYNAYMAGYMAGRRAIEAG